MATSDRPTGPYAPVRNVLDVVHRLRDRGVPNPLTAESLTSIGVPDGNAPRTLQALKFLNIVDSKGGITEPAERLRRASTDEYPTLLAEMIRAAYVPVFQLVDPAQDDEIKVADAFRQYDPAGQRDKMVTLFMGLCEEAHLVQPSEKRPARTTPPRRDRVPVQRRTGRGQTVDSTAHQRQGDGTGTTTPQPSSLLFGVTVEDIAALPADEFDAVWAALGKVAKARANNLAATDRLREALENSRSDADEEGE